ncbi:MAG: LuxR C-terminal-related transcriptional regulator [Dehalococcoidia bacterium]|nr:LuxR C-terminal-related transcriptional regulator [Dehalococcoidia bacterium]
MPRKSKASPNDANWEGLVTHDGMFVVDSRQRILYWSDNAERILGRKAAEVLGKPCHEVVAGQAPQNYRFCRRNCPIMAKARRGRPTPDYDILCTLPDGEVKWLNMSVAIPKTGRNTLQVIHLFRDVTGHRHTEEFARKASAALRELLVAGDGHLKEHADDSAPPLPQLSRREIEVLRLLASGTTTEKIASTLSIQIVTTRNYINRVLTKLGVQNRLQAVVFASEHKLI